jgi:ADP-dependent NAD(P)H-hydrate dehydratase / NAD(P)H-hydrate epimerase
MKIVSAAEMREIDRATSERFGVPSLTLMENAGAAVARFALKLYPQAKSFGVICGKGNNGGDGFVAARKLHEAGKTVRVLVLAESSELRGDAAQMFQRLPVAASVTVATSTGDLENESALKCDVLIDAILGTGFKPPVQGIYAAAISAMNSSRVPVIAVDIPSGADADSVIPNASLVARAGAVVTFTAPRPAHVFGHFTDGPTVLAPIGSPEEAVVSRLQLQVITPRDFPSLLVQRAAESNKGNFGHVLVLGGSLGKAGAAAMAGMAALRAGAGLVTVATPKSVLPTVAGFHPEPMTEPLEETEAGTISLRALEYGRMDLLAKGKTVFAIGPGISRNDETAEFVRTAVKKYKTPTVLDADGLNAFEGRSGELDGTGRILVITPHPGEMARLAGISIADVQKDRVGVARRIAREHALIVVLKGHRTLVAKPDGEVWVNTTGNAGMATGGTGDILTGMTAGLIGQSTDDELTAVVAAVYLHGMAGDIARERLGEKCLVASDLLSGLPEAFRRATEASNDVAISF